MLRASFHVLPADRSQRIIPEPLTQRGAVFAQRVTLSSDRQTHFMIEVTFFVRDFRFTSP
ncbi:MAG: hypothetical protein CO182_03995 [Lysobacterales bacterium CG_4_9_14_3_um_filter_62_6]|nr:MAG: hypothetical protein CO182_03995 [Xanthomonadales bacterium CG_4_9_14_3_um_filter_62_6]